MRFVAIGPTDVVETFCGRFDDAARCIADPDKRTYRAMGLGQYNLLRLFSDPALRVRRAENTAAGFRQNWKATRMKDAAQLPGAAFFDGAGTLRWMHRGKHPGDLPPMSDMLRIVTSLPPPR